MEQVGENSVGGGWLIRAIIIRVETDTAVSTDTNLIPFRFSVDGQMLC